MNVPIAESFEALPGRGAQARVEGRDLWAGGPRLMHERLGKLTGELVEGFVCTAHLLLGALPHLKNAARGLQDGGPDLFRFPLSLDFIFH